ncbi:MAG: hypothetical protein AABW63_00115 [Nanoarchaeota archaeon]
MIINKNGFNIEAILRWEDWQRLESGEDIGDRYDGDNKLIVHRIIPIDSNSTSSRLEFISSQYAEFNLVSSDIHVYIPHGVLKDVRISASIFDSTKGNLRIIPPENFGGEMSVKILYPGSLKFVDVSQYFESLST